MPLRQLLSAATAPLDAQLQQMLRSIREHLGLETAFVAEFVDGQRVFRHVDSSTEASPVRVGQADPLDESFCGRIAYGQLPELIPDVREMPAAAAIAATQRLPIGAHLSVPIRFTDGHLYGTFCCFSARADPGLTERDLALLRMLADFAGERLEREHGERRRLQTAAERIEAVLAKGALRCVYQPIVALADGHPVGFESLARFDALPSRAPDLWFAEAAEVGLDARLELAAISRALPALAQLPEPLYLSLNLSPSLPGADLLAALGDWPKSRLVLEITEHAVVEAYPRLLALLQPLREAGARVAVDDAGAGYASFRHILRLQPDYIKLDRSLTQRIDVDPAHRALAAALQRFANDTGSELIAEGVETATEAQALRELGIGKAQGYLFGRPAALPGYP